MTLRHYRALEIKENLERFDVPLHETNHRDPLYRGFLVGKDGEGYSILHESGEHSHVPLPDYIKTERDALNYLKVLSDSYSSGMIAGADLILGRLKKK